LGGLSTNLIKYGQIDRWGRTPFTRPYTYKVAMQKANATARAQQQVCIRLWRFSGHFQ
jgi:hypothetical protein